MNRILCPACFDRLFPDGHEEKTCTHGVFAGACTECGERRSMGQKPYWHCLGEMKEAPKAQDDGFYLDGSVCDC